MEPINKYTGIDLLIAQKCDDGNGILEEEKNEISIFTKAQQDFQASGEKQEVTIKGVRYYFNKVKNALLKIPEQVDRPHTEVPDATAVASTEEAKIAVQSEIKITKEEKEEDPKASDVKAIVLHQEVKRYRLKNGKFAQTLNDIPENQRQRVIERANTNAEKVIPMVLELCKKYEIEDLSPVIADMLGNETGGYVFNQRSMNPV